MFKKTIDKDDIKLLPLKKFEGETYLIDSHDKLKDAIEFLKNQPLLGFDTETRPSFKKGRTNSVALLQLSSENKAFLFRINKVGLPYSVVKILADKHILKVGVAIRDDIRILKKINPFLPETFIDLQDFVKNYGIEDMGLLKLAAIVLDWRISKAQQLSNWENELLTPAQLNYAATDAWICLEIYKKLLQNKHLSTRKLQGTIEFSDFVDHDVA